MFQWNPSDTDLKEPRKVTECTACGDNICEGDTYFHIPDTDEDYCKSCMQEYETVAEFNDGEGDNADREHDDRVAFEQNVNRLAVEMGDGDCDEM